jgi:hypothetical protein
MKLLTMLLLEGVHSAIALAGEDSQQRPGAEQSCDKQQVEHVLINRQARAGRLV